MERDAAIAIIQHHADELRELGVATLEIFGSVARGQARDDSDVDLLVTFSRPVGLLRFVEVKQRLEEILGRRVDLVLRRSLKPALREAVLAEAVRAA